MVTSMYGLIFLYFYVSQNPDSVSERVLFSPIGESPSIQLPPKISSSETVHSHKSSLVLLHPKVFQEGKGEEGLGSLLAPPFLTVGTAAARQSGRFSAPCSFSPWAYIIPYI